jgi:hypothetical protein
VTESKVLEFKPCGLANQKEVCYSNAVLQCLSRLIDPHDLRTRLGIVKPEKHETWYSGVDITSAREVDERIKGGLGQFHPAVDFLRVLKQLQNGRTDVVYPYHFQASLAAKGGKRGEEFASGGGAYPYCWFRFFLNSHCEGANFNGHSDVASHDVIDKMYKVESMSVWSCKKCFRTELTPNEKAMDWGLRLDPKGRVYSRLGRMSTGVQQLLDTRSRLTETIEKHCAMCKKNTRHYCTWKGLRLAPEVLCIEIKTYERNERGDEETEYKFLFSDVVLDEGITIPICNENVAEYALQSVVKLEGRGHEHAVAYVQSNSKRWWKCSDEDITRSTFGAAQSSCGDEQVSMLFYRKM